MRRQIQIARAFAPSLLKPQKVFLPGVCSKKFRS